MKSNKVLVTGAGGFLGGYIVRDLIDKEYDVYSFSRKQYTHLTKMGVTQFCGDLANYPELEKAFANMDAVIHTASLVGMWGKYDDFFRTNVIGTENVIKACLKNNISKLVYTSTPSVAYGKKELINVDESIPYPSKYISFYAQTKAVAEKMVLDSNSKTLSTVSLRPHLIFGPGDLNLIPRVIESHRKGKLKIIGDGKNLVDVTYVENASAVHVLALEKLFTGSSISGKAYFVGQGPVKLWEFTNTILNKAGLSSVYKKVSLDKAYFIGAVFEMIFKILNITKKEPPLTRFVALQLGTSHFFNHHNLVKDFDYAPKYTIEEGLEFLFSKKPLASLYRDN